MILGVIGGMGPEATVELFRRIVSATPAQRDQDHLHILIDNDPGIPDRTAAILQRGPSPLPALEAAAKRLQQAGATQLLIPCNTAHYWLPELQRKVGIPILNMVAETADAVAAHVPPLGRIGLLATTGTLEAKLYHRSLDSRGLAVVGTTSPEQECVMAVIYGIKSGSSSAGSSLVQVGRSLLERGAQGLILGCTELSLVPEMRQLGCPLFDPLAILARRAVALAKGADGGVP
jgi:aspartate racemase